MTKAIGRKGAQRPFELWRKVTGTDWICLASRLIPFGQSQETRGTLQPLSRHSQQNRCELHLVVLPAWAQLSKLLPNLFSSWEEGFKKRILKCVASSKINILVTWLSLCSWWHRGTLLAPGPISQLHNAIGLMLAKHTKVSG